MKVQVYRNGSNHIFDPSCHPREVEIEVTAQEVKEQQNRSSCRAADTVCRIKIVNENGDYAWFAITPVVKNGRPAVDVECS